MPFGVVEGGFSMGANGLDEYWVPEHVKDYLRKLGFALPPWMTWNPGYGRGMTG